MRTGGIVGVVGVASSAPAAGAVGGIAAAPVQKYQGSVRASHPAWGHPGNGGNWRLEGLDGNPDDFLISAAAQVSSTWGLWLSGRFEVCATVFSISDSRPPTSEVS